ncbi:UDP-N-acetylglucosamine pyrophosphorylase [Cryptosporidium andersoni]|uniref:UDP-N-acetylglucosamine diphosphorylase n=1 Tax=Cryptosporidium andersoni TaxID=117008 RepID=A0A1J4MQ03_9CRYT|nr:UDP-N-acetylglucosamine pyrophosphorylase [Cryptosporidium andersoni]
MMHRFDTIYKCLLNNEMEKLAWYLKKLKNDENRVEEYCKLLDDLSSIDIDYLMNIYEISKTNMSEKYHLIPPKRIVWEECNTIEQAKKCIEITKESIKDERCLITDIRTIPKGIYDYIYQEGIDLIKSGKVGIVIMSGGDGTRLGWNGPKGTYPIGIVSKKSLFQIMCERIICLTRICKADENKIPLYIMTSSSNYSAISEFFKLNKNFGLKEENIILFKQFMLPCIDIKSKSLMLSNISTINKSPNGNGGIFASMKEQGIIKDMKRRGIEYIFISTVDNPLCKIADPLFIGYSHTFNLDIATKTVARLDPLEKVGCLAQKINKNVMNTSSEDCKLLMPCIVEYTEMGDEINNSINEDTGEMVFSHGSIAIHNMKLTFVEEMGDKEFVYHQAIKKIPFYDLDTNKIIQPKDVNGVKLELFIFDCFKFANKVYGLEVLRSDEFAPIKSSTGQDTPTNCQKIMSELYRDFLLRVNSVICNSVKYVEISPLVSYSGEGLEHLKMQIFDQEYVEISE